MKLLIILTLFGTVSLMPMENKTVRNDENNNGKDEPTYCEPTTPCAWTPYNTITKQPNPTITNEYCICSSDLSCKVTRDDLEVASYVHHCRSSDYESDIALR